MVDPHRRGARRRWSFPIARVAGIEVRVHASFFALVALFVLAGAAPKGPGVPDALAWLVMIFACVVLHELAHCLVGRRRGLVVHEIDLLPIGGMSRLETLPETPRDEFAMAVAGPAASASLGLAFGALAVAASQSLYPLDLVNGPWLPRLAALNLLLAAFNMVPAFPLDGGRVLRSLLELRYDLARATRIAARTGRVLALAFVAIGIVWDLWLALIGVFLYVAANAEEAATLLHVRIAGRTVRDVMLVMPTTVDATVPAAALRQLIRRNVQGTFPVVRDGSYTGLIDTGMIEGAGDEVCAGELADGSAAVLAPDDSLEGDLPALASVAGHAVAVVDRGQVVGLLRLEEVTRLVAGTAGSVVGSE
jgi:Zn-dependent protease